MRVKLIKAETNKGAAFIQDEVHGEFNLTSYASTSTTCLLGTNKYFDLIVKEVIFANDTFSLEGFIINEEKQGGRGLLTFEILK